MSTRPSGISGKGNNKVFQRRILPKPEWVAREAADIETLLRNISYAALNLGDAGASVDAFLDRYPRIKSLNSFAKQIVIRMMRSNPTFQGYKVDFKDHVLKPHILLLIGTLCQNFDSMNTSPLAGCKVLEVGCGALAPYAPPREDHDLLAQFYSDHPPIAAEILQMLGAQTIGLDPRANSKEIYQYQTSYKHRIVEFVDLKDWLSTVEEKFDVITCFHVFNRSSFMYYYETPTQIAQFLRSLRTVISPQGLLYSGTPVLPISPENIETNRQIFRDAGFKLIYEGYDLIAEPI